MGLRARRLGDRVDVFAVMGERLAVDASVGVFTPVLADAGDEPDRPDLWEDLSARVDPVLFRPKLAADIEIKTFRLRWGNDYAIAANPRVLLHLTLEVWEAELAQRLDGGRTVGELIIERLDEDGDFDADAVVDLIQVFAANGFLEPHEVDVAKTVDAALEPRGIRHSLSRFAKTFQAKWDGADRFTRRLYAGGLRWLFTPMVAVVFAIIGVVGFVSFVIVERSGRYTLGGKAAPLESIALILMGWVLTFSHELGHAAALIHYHRRIKNAGFMLYFGSPAFFVDASDGLMLDRVPRIVQSFAGPFAELVLAGACSMLLFFLPQGGLAELLYRFSLLNYFVIFLNLVPLLELDGYWILSDVIQVPDLRPRSLEFTQHELWHKIRNRQRLSPQEIGLAVYGLVGVAHTVCRLDGGLLLEGDVRHPHLEPVARRDGPTPSAPGPSTCPCRPCGARHRQPRARHLPKGSEHRAQDQVPIGDGMARRSGGVDRRTARLRRSPWDDPQRSRRARRAPRHPARPTCDPPGRPLHRVLRHQEGNIQRRDRAPGNERRPAPRHAWSRGIVR